MAGFSITGQMKVATLQKSFLKEFGLTLRIYQGRSSADPTQTLAQVRKTKGTGKALAVAKNMKVGNLEDKFEAEFGLKVQVAGSDDSYLCDNDLTLNAAQQEDDKKVARKERKAARQTDGGGNEEEAKAKTDTKIKAFTYWEREEDSLKNWASSWVKAWKGETEFSEPDNAYPFLVINREPDFWWELADAIREVTENNEIEACTAAGPYCVDTEWLPENWGHECYVYQNYSEGELDSGVEYAEGESINYVAVRLSEFLGQLRSDTGHKSSAGVNDLSPRQFAELITYLSQNIDESLDITKNDFECGPFILRPVLDWIADEIVDENGIDQTNEIAERTAEKLDSFVDELANATGDDVFCFYF